MEERFDEQLIKAAYISAEAMEKRILNGKVLKDVIIEYESGKQRILITLTETGEYGYAVYAPADAKTPHYLAESIFLIEDLSKRTDYRGYGLGFFDGKSVIQRNLVGIFKEYIKDPGFESYYASLQMPVGASMKVAQHMAGYNPQDPVTILCAHFRDGYFACPLTSEVLIDNENGKPILRILTARVNDKGEFDYDKLKEFLMEAAEIDAADAGVSYESAEKVVNQIFLQGQKNIQSIFYELYEQLGLPILEGVTPSNLISAALRGEDVRGYFKALDNGTIALNGTIVLSDNNQSKL